MSTATPKFPMTNAEILIGSARKLVSKLELVRNEIQETDPGELSPKEVHSTLDEMAGFILELASLVREHLLCDTPAIQASRDAEFRAMHRGQGDC